MRDDRICRVGTFEARLRIDEAVPEFRGDCHHLIEGALDKWNELTSIHTPPFKALDQQYRTPDLGEDQPVLLDTAVVETPVGMGRIQPASPAKAPHFDVFDLCVGCVVALRAWPIARPCLLLSTSSGRPVDIASSCGLGRRTRDVAGGLIDMTSKMVADE